MAGIESNSRLETLSARGRPPFRGMLFPRPRSWIPNVASAIETELIVMSVTGCPLTGDNT